MIQVKKNEMNNQPTTCNGTSLVDPVLKREWRVSHSRKRAGNRFVPPSSSYMREKEREERKKENHKLVRERIESCNWEREIPEKYLAKKYLNE